MSRRHVAALLLLLGPAVIPSSVAAGEGCHLKKLSPSPTWVGSGAFTEKGEVLLIADPQRGAVLAYSRQDGRPLEALPPRLDQSLQAIRPQVIQQQGDQLYLEVAQNRLVTLGANYVFKGKKSIKVTEAKTGQKMAGSYLWQPVGSDFLSITDIQLPNEDWWGAIVRFPADNPAAYSVLRWVPLFDSSKVFYRLGFPYLANIGDDGYLLMMDNDPGIYRSAKGKKDLEPLGALGGILGHSPTLPFFGKRDVAQVMAKVERSKMPTGLYGWKGSLYIVMREPRKQGTGWTIFKINPEGKGEVIGSAPLPTRANHLTIVPGEKSWAFIEEGPVEAWGRQRVGNTLFIPAERIEKIEGPKPGILCSPNELTP